MQAILAPAHLLISGNRLNSLQQKHVLAAYVHRFTGQHKPTWAQQLRPDGTAYPVQFKDDADWLANTQFVVTRTGALDSRYDSCIPTATWPLNPELRRDAQPVTA